MTIGIYRLVFEGTSSCYVGQSINIEKRYEQHIKSLYLKTANQKMLAAYSQYGIPSLDILCECTIEELDTAELEAITIFDSVNSGFNILDTIVPAYKGQNHPRSRYSNEKILEVAKLLTDTSNKAIDISNITGVAIATIQDVASLKAHGWIKEADPEIYSTLEKLKGTRKNPKGIAARGISYPDVISPDGSIFSNIQNLKKFCDEHGLCRPNFRKLLQGKIKSSLGWKLVIHG